RVSSVVSSDARARRARRADDAAERRGGNQNLRAARSRGMLRLRRDVLGEVPTHLSIDARRQDDAHQGERRGGRGRERLRMSDADRRRLEPRRRKDRGASSGRSALGEVKEKLAASANDPGPVTSPCPRRDYWSRRGSRDLVAFVDV